LIDSHVHLEKGPYTLDWLLKFVKTVEEREISVSVRLVPQCAGRIP